LNQRAGAIAYDPPMQTRTDGQHDASTHQDASAGQRRETSGLARVLFVIGILVTLAGGCAWIASALIDGGEPEVSAVDDETEGLVQGLAGNDDATARDRRDRPRAREQSALSEWSPTIFRLGFGFVVGFAIAFALRAFLRLAILILGVILIGLFALQYFGIVSVDWNAMSGGYDTVMEWLRVQFASMKSFVQGALPSAGSAAAGFFFGFRRA
jgi:uncharacterized membrane protein (Fun14 family)